MTPLPQLVAVADDATALACDALVVGAFSETGSFSLDQTAAALDDADGGRLTSWLRSSGFKAGPGEVAILPSGDAISASAVAVVGLGDHAKIDSATLRKAAGSAARRLSERAVVGIALHSTVAGAEGPTAEGLLLGSYRFTSYKSEPKTSKLQRLLFVDADESALERAAIVAEATWMARDLTNEPPSNMTPETLAERARAAGDVCGFECTVWTERELKDHGFGGLLGVSSGSDVGPRFIQMHYAPGGTAKKVALIGKGVTFDSGGLSLKDATNMETMKTDMGGAAAVIGAMTAISKLKPAVEVIAFVPATENMPSGTAIKPGDVLKHYGGKTTEVLNTDAEGRLRKSVV